MSKFFRHSVVALGIVFSQAGYAADDSATQPEIQTCPSSFFSIHLPASAKQCQLFDGDTPASMIFFSPENKDALIKHFQSTVPSLKITSTFNGYTLLTGEHDTLRIIVSTDGKGSQVDVLVIPNSELAKNL
ncbi:hypothetical protein [Alteromonas sp. ASW11-130]|uniref:hypothetical protein n=1 Tax=Alteromonas sp. ASW11-130 TaxID=3015775 RepID=UPI002241E5F7|nr:hypothetical protein [Alteromonas sp. ASW11-130]MCW8092837.1 hypothetical protein [Alteromonas sp. ASW11-130]